MVERFVEHHASSTSRSLEPSERASAVMPGGGTPSVPDRRPAPSFLECASGCRLFPADDADPPAPLDTYSRSIPGQAPPAVVAPVDDRFARGSRRRAPPATGHR